MSGGPASGGAGGASAPVRSEAARLADARAARATNDPVAPVRTEVGGEASAGGGAPQTTTAGTPVRLSHMAAVMLAKIKQLGEPVTMSDIRNVLGVRTGHVEAGAELREKGYVEIHDRADGRKVWKITPAGVAAHLENIRRERA